MSMDAIRTYLPRTFQILWVLHNKVALVSIRTKVFRIVPHGISHLKDTKLES